MAKKKIEYPNEIYVELFTEGSGICSSYTKEEVSEIESEEVGVYKFVRVGKVESTIK